MTTHKIYLADHLNSVKPKDTTLFESVQVGAHLATVENRRFTDMIGDDFGDDNISLLNNLFSELTVQHMIWKNSTANFVGVGHYRRMFLPDGIDSLVKNFPDVNVTKEYGKDGRFVVDYRKDVFDYVFNSERFKLVQQQLENTPDAIVTLTPFRKTNKFALFTLADIGWVPVKTVILLYEYMHDVLPKHEMSIITDTLYTHDHYCNNMIYTSKSVFDEYSEWLFDILLGFYDFLFARSDSYNLIVPRMFGYFSEYLLKPYLIIHGYTDKKTDKTIFEYDSICFDNMKTDNRI